MLSYSMSSHFSEEEGILDDLRNYQNCNRKYNKMN